MPRHPYLPRIVGRDIKDLIIEFIEAQGRRPVKDMSNREEYRLAKWMHRFVSPNNPHFDSVFAELVDLVSPQVSVVESAKRDILAFVKEHRRVPSAKAPVLSEERRLAHAWHHYFTPCRPTFEAALWDEVRAIVNPRVDRRDGGGRYAGTYPRGIPPMRTWVKDEDVLAFCREHKRRPSAVSGPPEERRLGARCARRMCPTHRLYQEEFESKVKDACDLFAYAELFTVDLAPDVRAASVMQGKLDYLAFCEKHNRRPSKRAEDRAERLLGLNHSLCFCVTNRLFDPIFYATVNRRWPAKGAAARANLITFVATHKRIPSQRIQGLPGEKTLAKFVARIVSPSSPGYDPEFAAELAQLLASSNPNP